MTVNGDVDLGGTGLAHLSIELGGTAAGTGYDQLVLTNGGSLNLANVELDGAFANNFNTSIQEGEVFYIIVGSANAIPVSQGFTNQGGVDPNFPGFSTINIAGLPFAISYTAAYNGGSGSAFSGAGNDVALMAIPEPNAISMLAGSLGLALGLQRFRRGRKYRSEHSV
jgi:hypothetical protein